MNKKIFLSLVLVIIIVIIYGLFSGKLSEEKLIYTAPGVDTIAKTGTLYVYTVAGEPNGGGTLNLSFTRNSDYSLLNVVLDLNNNGQYESDEWVVQNEIRLIASGAKDNSTITLPTDFVLTGSITAQVVFLANEADENWWQTAESQEVSVDVSTFELNDILGLDVAGNGPGVYRGFTDGFGGQIPIVYAGSLPVVNVDSELAIGDIRQSNMECAPTSITNNVQALAEKNGRRSDLPNAETMIEQLKEDLKFGDEGIAGVLDKNYLAGKDAFMQRYNLPIVTTEISNPSIEDIAQAIEGGAVVEMDLAFIDAAAGNNHVASHVVTLTGVSSDGNRATLRGRDSATPEGNESWQFFPKQAGQPTTQMHYPLWRSATVVNKIYIQTWTEDSTSTSVNQENNTSLQSEEIKPVLNLEATFAHVKPGEYSEIYSVVTGLTPGDEIEVWLADTSGQKRKKTGVADNNGTVHHTWRITSFGSYDISFQPSVGAELKVNVIVK